MNLINYNQVMEALDKERQLLLNREQYGAENVLVHHAINVIAELPIIKQPEVVRCKDCKYCHIHGNGYDVNCLAGHNITYIDGFCSEGKKRETSKEEQLK